MNFVLALSVPPCLHLPRSFLFLASQRIMIECAIGCSTDMPALLLTLAPTARCIAWQAPPLKFTSIRPRSLWQFILPLQSLSIDKTKCMKICFAMRFWRFLRGSRMVNQPFGAIVWLSLESIMALHAAPLTFPLSTNSAAAKRLLLKLRLNLPVVFPEIRGRRSPSPGTAVIAFPYASLTVI